MFQLNKVMSFFNNFFRILKRFVVLILILAIAIPVWYKSTNREYLTIRLLHSFLSLKHALLPDSTRPTLSADYRGFENILRMKPIAEEDPLTDPIIYVKNLRASFAMGTIIPKPSQCKINDEKFEYDGHSVQTYWVDYPTRKFQTKSDKLLVYFHGGGYILGDIHSKLFNIYILKSNRILYFHRLQWN